MEIRDYDHILEVINEGIDEFNGYLSQVRIEKLSIGSDEKSYLNLRAST